MNEAADLLLTLDLCTALKKRLLEIEVPTAKGVKLFDVVDFHLNKSLGDAMRDLLILKPRVCLIVPSGDSYRHEKEGRTIRSERTTSLDLLMADVAYTRGGQAAVFGGDNNIGVLAMKDIVVTELAETPQLEGIRWCALYPVDGAQITIAPDEQKKLPGRVCYALNYETPSGWITSQITKPYPERA